MQDLQQALQMVRGNGRYQLEVSVIFGLAMFMCSYSLYSLPYYELQPRYECRTFNETTGTMNEWVGCKVEDICKTIDQPGSEELYRVDWTATYSLNNWVQQYNLMCTSKNEMGAFGSLFFVGLVVGSLWVPRLSDYFGRKIVMLFGMAVHIITCLVVVTTTSMKVGLAALFINGMGMTGRVFVGYVWVSGFLNPEEILRRTAYVFFFDGLGLLWGSIYFRFISKEWQGIFLLPLVIVCITFCVLFCKWDSP